MTISCSVLRSTCCLLVLSVSASAQNPFGGDDPFGGDPFRASAKQPNASPNRNTDKTVTTNPKTQPPQKHGSVEAHIRSVLSQRTSQSFVELPLADAVGQLSEAHDIPIVVDSRALEELGISPDEPTTLSLRDVSLRSFLRIALSQLDLTYAIRNEVLVITTHEAAERNLTLQTYPFPEVLTEKSQQVLTALQATVSPDKWESTGGLCTAAVVENVLIVSATEPVHEAVVEFLEKLEDAFQRSIARRRER